MAEGNGQGGPGAPPGWNLSNLPSSVNRAETSRMRENLSRVVRDLLPELGNQPGVLLPGSRLSGAIPHPALEISAGGGGRAVLPAGATAAASVADDGASSRSSSHPRAHGHGQNRGHYHPYPITHGHRSLVAGGSRSTIREQRPTSAATAALSGVGGAAGGGRDPAASLVINIGADNFPRHSDDDDVDDEEIDFGFDVGSQEADENQNTTGSPGHVHGDPAGGGPAPSLPLRSLLRMMEGIVPFLILLFIKIMYSHRLGILVFVGLFLTFCYANKTLRRHIAQRVMLSHSQDEPLATSSIHLLWIIVFLAANITVLYYVFRDQQLYNSLLLRMPQIKQVDLWMLLWVVGITDFIIKFGAILLKAIVALVPRALLQHKKKGKFYMIIEHFSQFYRCLVPIPPWIAFLKDDKDGGQWLAYLLLVIYIICKGQHMWRQGKELRKALSKFQVDVSYGSCPSRDDLSTADNCCPICQDKFNEPVKLSCKHIFCEDCVSMWFDRERTCPMCRANIVDNPVWRDGTTAGTMQLF